MLKESTNLVEWKDARLHEVFYKSVVKQDTLLVVDCLSYGADINRHFPIVSCFIKFELEKNNKNFYIYIYII